MTRMTPDHTSDGSTEASSSRRRVRTAQETRERRRRHVTMGLSLALAVLGVNSIVGENGYLASLRLRAEEGRLRAAVAALRLDNQRLQDEGRRLGNDPDTLEEAARRSLGLLRPGETLLIYRPARPAPPSPASR
jgi:cell division protein FtsB